MTTRDDHTQTTQTTTTQTTTTQPAQPAQPAQPTEATVAVSVNGARREISAGSTLDALVAALTTAPSGVAAAVNETVVPRGTWQRTVLRAGDRVEVLTAVQGG